jgi:hypothetical protein
MGIYNSIEMERATGVTAGRLQYAIRKGRIGGFAKVRGGWAFTQEDLERIRAFFADRPPYTRFGDNFVCYNTGDE